MKKRLQFLLLMSLITISIFGESKDYVLVNGGNFIMGNNDGGSLEYPRHDVELNSFYMSKYEVTTKEFNEVMGFNPSLFSGDNKPVENVTWYDTVMYTNKLSQKEGETPYYIITNIKKDGDHITYALVETNKTSKGYRLPTEAEWEYAANGGQQSKGYKYSGSNNTDEVAWYKNNSGTETHVVGQKKANELNIFDMSGNVWEWCWDGFDYYSYNNQINPIGSIISDDRVARGGFWGSKSSGVTTTFRYHFKPSSYDYIIGFRLAKSY